MLSQHVLRPNLPALQPEHHQMTLPVNEVRLRMTYLYLHSQQLLYKLAHLTQCLTLLFHTLTLRLSYVLLHPEHVLCVVLYLSEMVPARFVRLVVHPVLLLLLQVLVHQLQRYQNHVWFPINFKVLNVNEVPDR